MRTALEVSPTKERLLNTAQGLILENGFVGTTVDDICQTAKLTKGSFFHYFDSKDALGIELLNRYCSGVKEAFSSGYPHEEKDVLKRVHGFLDSMIRITKEKAAKGCLMGSMAQELSDSHPEIRSICVQAFLDIAEVLKNDLAEAKAKYGVLIDPKGLSEHFVAIIQGSALVAKVKQDPSPMENSLKHYKEYLKSLFKK